MKRQIATAQNLVLSVCGVLVGLIASSASAQPINDNFANRIPLTGSNFTFRATNVGAMAELCPDGMTYEPAHTPFGDGPHRSVWYAWTAPFFGGAVVEVVADPSANPQFDYSTPALAAYQGSSVCDLVQLAASSSSYYRARIVFDVVRGFTYPIALDGATDGGEGTATVSLQFTPLPTNSFDSGATVISGDLYTISTSFVGGRVARPQNLWWRWTAPTNNGVSVSEVRLTADAVSFPPDVRVFRGSDFRNLAPVAVFHRTGGVMRDGIETNGMTSTALFDATAGTNYYLRLSGWQQDPSGNDISARYGTFHFQLNRRALALSVLSLVTNKASTNAPVSFTTDVRIDNRGTAPSNPLRVSVSAVPGVSVQGPDGGTVPTNEIVQGIWTVARACTPAPSGLLTWWRAEGNAQDAVGPNHGTLFNGASFTEGLAGQTFRFDGIDDHIRSASVVAGTPAGTVEMWFEVNHWNWNASAAGLYLWAGTQGEPNTSAGDGINLGTHPGYSMSGELMFGIYEYGTFNDWHWAKSGFIPVPGTWYHVTGTWGPAGLKIYINGTLRGRDDYSGPAPNNITRGLLGCSTWPGTFIDGQVDEVSFYNRALMGDEIAALYNAGGAGKCPMSSPGPPIPAQQTSLRLSAITPGTERVQLVSNGDFQFRGLPVAGAYPHPIGWERSGQMYVGPGTNMILGNDCSVAQALVSARDTAAGYIRAVTLQPATEYVLSAYLWNFGDAANHVNTVVDLADAPSEAQLVLYVTDPGADRGYFAHARFNTAVTGSNLTLRCFYDGLTANGAAPRYYPVGAQWDNIAITRADAFRAPLPSGGSLILAPGQSAMVRICGTVPPPTIYTQTNLDRSVTTVGIGYGVYAQLQEEAIPTRWFTTDQQLVVIGDWPQIGTGEPGPNQGVIRLDPGYIGVTGYLPTPVVSIIGPSNVLEGSSAPYYARASYDNVVIRNFTNTAWSASQFRMTTNGVFTAGNVTSDTTVSITAPYSYQAHLLNVTTNVTVINLPPPSLVGSRLLPNGSYSMTLTGVPNRSHLIEATTKLNRPAPATDWLPLATNAPASGLWNFVDPSRSNFTRRFYRAREVP